MPGLIGVVLGSEDGGYHPVVSWIRVQLVPLRELRPPVGQMSARVGIGGTPANLSEGGVYHDR